MPRPELHLVGRRAPTVTVERHLVVGAAMNAKALADDIDHALAAIEARLWAGNRAAAVNEIGRAHHRIAELRQSFLDLAGIADRAPSDPTDAVVAA
jgi:predicted metal-dependent TIM-barrel fold hydrolase